MLSCEFYFEIGNFIMNIHGKKFGADAAPSGGVVAFSGGEFCDNAFGYTFGRVCTRGVSWNLPVLLIDVARDMYTFLWFGIYVIFFYGQ